MYPYNQNAYGRPPVQMPPGMQLPPGFSFPPGTNPPPGSAPPNFVAPGVAAVPPGIIPHVAQANLPARPGVPAFPAPASLPNINFNAPIIRLGTSSTKAQPGTGTSSQSQSSSTGHATQNSKSSANQNSALSFARESASSFVAPTFDEQIKSVFVGSLPSYLEDEWVERILKAAGPVRKWMRVSDEVGNLRSFGFCEYESFEGVLAAVQNIHGLRVPHAKDDTKASIISVISDDRAEEFMNNIRDHDPEGGAESNDLTSRYDSIKLAINGIVSEYTDPDRQADAKHQEKAMDADGNLATTDDEPANPDNGQPEVVTISLSIDDELADIPADMRETVSKEIAAFRERSNRRDIERIKREEEIEQQERDRMSGGGRNYRFGSPPASAPTGPSAGPNSIPVGPSRLRGDAPPSAPTGPAAQSVKFVSGSTSNGARLAQEDDDSDASDSELEARRKQKKLRETDAIFLDHERRWLNRERSRTSAIERESVRDKDDFRREEIEKSAMSLRLSEWDDDIEMERRAEDYYIDRSLWIRNRTQFRAREKDMDARDRAMEERLLENEKKATENANSHTVREKNSEVSSQLNNREVQSQPRIKLSLGASIRNKTTDLARGRRTVADIEGLLEDEEEDVSKTRRVLIPIKYEDTAGVDDESREELVKALAHEIPSDRDGLWNWKVNWDFVDDAMIKEKLQPFVEKKIVEYLGVQEQELITFVLEHIKKRGSAADLVKELEMALDEDAEVLVKKIWRMLIFFSEGEKRGLVT